MASFPVKNTKTIHGDVVEDFEGAGFSTVWGFSKRSFCDGEVGKGSSGMNAICGRPEVVEDVISGEDADSFQCYACVRLGIAFFSSFRENLNHPFM